MMQIYENLIHIQSKIKNSRSYEVSFSGGFKHYVNSRELADDAKAGRQSEIEDWNNKISCIKAASMQKAKEKAQKCIDDHWTEHAEEKVALESEKGSLQEQISAFKKEKESIPAKAEAETLREHIWELRTQRDRLGLFKGKEKRALQDQINAVEKELYPIQEEADKADAEIQAKIDQLQKRVTEINEELTRDR